MFSLVDSAVKSNMAHLLLSAVLRPRAAAPLLLGARCRRCRSMGQTNGRTLDRYKDPVPPTNNTVNNRLRLLNDSQRAVGRRAAASPDIGVAAAARLSARRACEFLFVYPWTHTFYQNHDRTVALCEHLSPPENHHSANICPLDREVMELVRVRGKGLGLNY